jgi:hypothetical protein
MTILTCNLLYTKSFPLENMMQEMFPGIISVIKSRENMNNTFHKTYGGVIVRKSYVFEEKQEK